MGSGCGKNTGEKDDSHRVLSISICDEMRHTILIPDILKQPVLGKCRGKEFS